MRGGVDRDGRVDVDGLRLMQSQFMDVFRLDRRVVIEQPCIPNIPCLRIGVAVGRIHQAAYGTGSKLARRCRKRRQWIDAESPEVGGGIAWRRGRSAGTRTEEFSCPWNGAACCERVDGLENS